MKVCIKCKLIKQLSEFTKRASKYRTVCKDCRAKLRAKKEHLIDPIRFSWATRKKNPRKWNKSEVAKLCSLAAKMGMSGMYDTMDVIKKQSMRCSSCTTSLNRFKNETNGFINKVQAYKANDVWELYCAGCSKVICAMKELHSAGPVRALAAKFAGSDIFAPRVLYKPSQAIPEQGQPNKDLHGATFELLPEWHPCLKQKKSSWEIHLNTRKLRGNSPELQTALLMMLGTYDLIEADAAIRQLIQEDNRYTISRGDY